MKRILTFLVKTLRPRQNGTHFADDIFKCILLNENVGVLLKISLKFVAKFRNNNISALVQKMAWHRPGNNPLFEPMMVILLTHICVTRPQRVKVINGDENVYMVFIWEGFAVANHNYASKSTITQCLTKCITYGLNPGVSPLKLGMFNFIPYRVLDMMITFPCEIWS